MTTDIRHHDQESRVLANEAKINQLLQALGERAPIKAAVVVATDGTPQAYVGGAHALKAAAGDTDEFGSVDPNPNAEPTPDPAKENVYLTAVGPDFLVVVFDNSNGFDPIKQDVDTLVDSLEFHPPDR